MFNISKKDKRDPENIKEILGSFNKLKNDFKKLSEEIENLKEDHKFSIQKIGTIRFNPFNEVGSDQSFSVALLDERNSGVVITSLYNRQENRIYAKPIVEGASQYVLSEEEVAAIEKAKNSKEAVEAAKWEQEEKIKKNDKK